MPRYVERVGGRAAHPTIVLYPVEVSPYAIFIMKERATGKKKARYKSGPKSNSFLRRVGGDKISMLRYSI